LIAGLRHIICHSRCYANIIATQAETHISFARGVIVMARQDQRNFDKDDNRDAITGEPGSHPLGAGLGAAAGGAAAGAAAAAATGGPVGAVVGAVVGGIMGGYAGKEIAEQIDPTAEAAYWRGEYRKRDYYDPNLNYEIDVAPAYEFGWQSRGEYPAGNWDAVEADLRDQWMSRRGGSTLDWDRAMPAARDAWNRVDANYGPANDDDTAPPNRPR
jgi:hypothetical protein